MAFDASGDKLDGGDEEPGCCAFDGALEALGLVGALGDLDGPLAHAGQCGTELSAGIAAIGEDMAQPRISGADRGQHTRRPVAVSIASWHASALVR